jgi:alpha-tubulin suppressor-like RCC1 family protein
MSAVIVLVGVISLTSTSPVGARPTERHSGHASAIAPGSATCSVSATVRFSPPLTVSGGGNRPSAFAGPLSDCNFSNGGVTIAKAAIRGSFATSPISCETMSSTASTAAFTITWRGSLGGTGTGTTPGHRGVASFMPTTEAEGVATGSFAGVGGAAGLTLPFPARAKSVCTRARGIKELTLKGTVSVEPPTATSVASDGNGYCAILHSGRVDCWGANSFGQLGDGTTRSSEIPVVVSGITGAVSLASDSVGYCAVLTSGSVACWGLNTQGELGDGTTGGPDCAKTCNPTPAAVLGIPPGGQVTSVASNGYSYCAVLSTLPVECWGDNSDGELGNGTVTGSASCTGLPCNPTPGAVSAPTATLLATDGSDGAYSYCALLTTGPVDCWGDTAYGQLGDGTTTGPDCIVSGSGTCNPTPAAVLGLPTDASVTSLATDAGGYCSVVSSGAVDCWGGNADGALGNGATTSSDVAGPVVAVGGTGTLTDVSRLASDGNSSYCAVTTVTAVDCWGFDNSGQLGDGTTTSSDLPVAVSAVGGSGTLTDVVGVVSNDTSFFYCALLGSGSVDCWGGNGAGQLGNGTTTNSDVPTAVVDLPSRDPVTSLASGYFGDCALLASGSVRCWGDALGNGTTATSDRPVSVVGIGP